MEGALPSPAAVMESHVLNVLPRCPFSSLKGRWRKLERLQGTESSQGTHIHHHSCSHKLQVHHPFASPRKTPKPQLGSMAGLGWACPSARIQPRAKPSTLIRNLLPSLVTGRARGSSPCAERRVFVQGRAVLWGISLLLVCLCPGLCHQAANTSPRAPCCQQCPVRDPHSSEMQSTQQACAWRWHKGGF